jgi:hypothetical protein
MCSDTVFTMVGGVDNVNASCGRSHGWQYCAVTASRLWSFVRLAPPPCHSVPAKNTTEPAGIATLTSSSASVGRRSSPQRWLPGITTVAPLSAVKSVTAQMVAALNGARGRGTGYMPSSKCSSCPVSPGPILMACS